MDLQTEDEVRKNCKTGHKVPPAMTEVNKCPQITKRIQLPMVKSSFLLSSTQPTMRMRSATDEINGVPNMVSEKNLHKM